MPLSVEDFWRLACKSRLLTVDEARALHAAFQKLPNPPGDDPRALAKWLVARKKLTRYQASVLLAGKTGPLVCGDYRVEDRVASDQLPGLLRARHTPTKQAVLLRFLSSKTANDAAWLASARHRIEVLKQLGPHVFLAVRGIETAGKYRVVVGEEPLGQPLNAWLTARSSLSPEHAWSIARDVARAVAGLHASGELQGALSADHVWIDDSPPGQVQLLGFPLCNEIASATMPDDLAALGQILNRLLQSTAAPQSAPAIVKRLVRELTTKSSAAKSPTAAAVADALEALLEDQPPSDADPLIAISDAAPHDPLARLQSRRQTQRSRNLVLAVVAGILLLIAGLGGAYWWWAAPGQTEVAGTNNNAPTPSTTAESSPPTTPAAPPPAVDPNAFWQSPTSGEPIQLRYLPLGAPCYVEWRAGDFLSHPEGAKLLDTLGPIGQPLLDEVARLVSVPLETIERLTMGLYDAGPATWQVSLVVELRDPPPLTELIEQLGDPAEADATEGLVYRGSTHAYYFPLETPGLFAVVPLDRLDDVVESGDAAPFLRREFEQLLATTDQDRQVTLLFAPTFFWHGGGQPLVAGPLKPIDEMFTQLVGDRAQAVSASLHLDDNFFAELRVVGPTDERSSQTADRLQTESARLPEQIERRVQSMYLAPYSREVLERYPLMVRAWSEHVRIQEEDREVALRSYLPAVAAHNLALGLQLSLASPHAPPPESSTPEDMPEEGEATGLEQIVSLSFPRNTLERALEMLGEEIGLPVEILGSDLQLEGITKNQSFGLDLRERPAVEILREILLLASPDGKLVYVLRPADGGQPATIVVTTRAAATKRGDPLPPEFASE